MDTSQPDNQASPEQPVEEHETHTTALIFMVVAVIIISFVALQGGEVTSPFDTDTDDEVTTQDEDPSSHGSLIPQRAVETTDTTSLTDLPDGIFVEEDRISSNKTAEGNHQIVKFSTDRSVESLYAAYEAWMTDADYEIHQRLEDEYGAKLAARGPADEQLTVAITHADDDTDPNSVMIDYVAAQ